VRSYVSKGVSRQDPTRLVQIGYDANANRGRKPTSIWSHDKATGELVEHTGDDRLARLIAAYRDPILKRKLKPWEMEDVEKALATSSITDADLASAALPAPVAAAAPVAKPRKVAPTRACGAAVWPMHFPKHKAACEVCAKG
jgi:hypothetical protein